MINSSYSGTGNFANFKYCYEILNEVMNIKTLYSLFIVDPLMMTVQSLNFSTSYIKTILGILPIEWKILISINTIEMVNYLLLQ